jgi:hypothetical protein
MLSTYVQGDIVSPRDVECNELENALCVSQATEDARISKDAEWPQLLSTSPHRSCQSLSPFFAVQNGVASSPKSQVRPAVGPSSYPLRGDDTAGITQALMATGAEDSDEKDAKLEAIHRARRAKRRCKGAVQEGDSVPPPQICQNRPEVCFVTTS